jgi:gliding motility-associated-like protein
MKLDYIRPLVFMFLLLTTSRLTAQVETHASPNPNMEVHEHTGAYGDSLDGFNPDAIMARANAKGLQPWEAAMYLGRMQRLYINKKYGIGEQPVSKNIQPPSSERLAPMNNVAQVPCTNMDFEQANFTGWTGAIGDNNLSSLGPLQNVTPGIFSTTQDALLTDCAARHTIVSAASGNDPCGAFPAVAPNGGLYSVRMGQTCASYQGEILEQTFTVAPGNTSFTYEYAVVLNDGGHSAGEQPYFKIEMFDQSGNLIPCSQYFVEASGSVPGFVQCTPGVFYKPWSTVNVDLSAYLATNVTIRFTVAGCIYAGHYGYAYIDASCLPYQIQQNAQLCTGGSVQLCAPAGAASYLWMPGGQTTQCITTSTPNTYTVTMVSVTNCTTSLTQVVTLYPQPQASFTATFAPCSPNYTFNNTSTISSGNMTYHWDFGDPNLTNDTSNVTNPSFVYNAGNYTVTLIATSNNGCADTITQVVNPGNGGQAAFSSSPVCLNNATNFTDLSVGASSWSWHFGEPSSGPNDSSNVQNPSHTYSAPGSYTVTLIAQTNPCPSVVTQVIVVNPLPVCSFTMNQICGGQVVNFTNTSTILVGDTINGWSWNFGDPGSGPNNISNLQNPQHVFSGPGTYTVILTVTSSDGCQSTSSQQVVVGPSPVAAFTANNVCTNSPMSFTNNSSNTNTYHWDFGDVNLTNDTSNVLNPQWIFSNAGNYTVTLIASPGSPCADTTTLVVSVLPGPNNVFSAPTVCLGSTTNFANNSTISVGSITAYHWDFGVANLTNDTSNAQTPSYTYTAAGTYVVTLTTTSNNGCQTTTTINVTVNSLPTAAFSNTPACANSPMQFTDLSVANSGNIASWVWDFGDNSPNSNVQNPSHAYANMNAYNVTLIVTTSNGCVDTIVQQVQAAPVPQVQFVADTLAGCPVLCVNFSDQSTIASGNINGWVWDFGDGNTANTQNPQHCYTQTGVYTVSLTVYSAVGCADSLTINNMITVYPVPVASFSATPQTTTVLQPTVNFTDQSQGANSWHWDFGDGDTLGLLVQNPQHTFSNEIATNYDVTLTVTNQYGCQDDTTIEVIVGPDFTFFIPNAFTPNGDGLNDGFFGTGIGITEYQIWIFDRWGNMIFTTKDMTEAWDGTVHRAGSSGEICQQDVYVWKVALKDVFDKSHKYIGHVTIVR